MRKSLGLRLVALIFVIMLLANTITGVVFLIFSSNQDTGLARLFFSINHPIPLLILSLALGTILSALFIRLFLRPIRSLIGATKRVAQGDFTVRVEKTGGKGEMNELVGSFNEMARELGSNELFKKDFINSFSHEFKTPIVSIRGFARQLQRDDLTDAERKEYAGIIAAESERLANMSTNILLLNRLENEEIIANRSDCRLDESLRSTVLLMEKQWSEKNLELDLNLDEVHANLNEEIMSHVWINLIGNAIKFSNDGGKLGVSCAADGENVTVTISDTGIGMDEETQRHIFDRFYQGAPSHATEGNGLGLALVKRIIDLCGGKIDVKSAPNEGSAFTVTLPNS